MLTPHDAEKVSSEKNKKGNTFYIESNDAGDGPRFPEVMPVDLRQAAVFPSDVYLSCIQSMNSSLAVDFKYILVALSAMIIFMIVGVILIATQDDMRVEYFILAAGGAIGAILCGIWLCWMKNNGCIKRVQNAAADECMPFCLKKGIYCTFDVSQGKSRVYAIPGEKAPKVLILAIEVCTDTSKLSPRRAGAVKKRIMPKTTGKRKR